MFQFAERLSGIKKSFIREILKSAADPTVISFAGGLPNPHVFPVKAIQAACSKVLESDGTNALQYSTTEGYEPLRTFIADRYNFLYDLDVSPKNILITNGSQQGVDLMGKVLLNDKDKVVIEQPGYLGAIQALSVFQSQFLPIDLKDSGVDLDMLEKGLAENPKLFYCVPNFQNPSGITYSADTRTHVAELLKNSQTVLLEDNPYGEIRFMGEDVSPIKKQLGDKGILLGSFSKTVVPSFRHGWICAADEIMEKLIVVKQGADLHTNYFTQRVVYQFLVDNNLEEHLERTRLAYKVQRDAMVSAITDLFPKSVNITQPEGGMFLWVTLPSHIKSMELFEKAILRKVAFVPGEPFYVNGGGEHAMRLNYSNSNPEEINRGIKILADIIKSF